MRRLTIWCALCLSITAALALDAALASARPARSSPAAPGSDHVLLGSQAVATVADGGQSASEAFGYTAGATGTATSFSVYLDSTQGVELGLYADQSGQPGTRLTWGYIRSNAAGWVTVPVWNSAHVISGTRYWIVIASFGTNTVGYRDAGNSGSNLDFSGTALTSPYAITGHWTSNPASVYVSGTTSTPPPVAPANTAVPGLSGPAQQGQTMTASTGTWTGTAPITYSYQWQDNGTTNIPGATSASYTASAADVGQTLDAVVTAKNVAGATAARSGSSAVVAGPAAPANIVAPTISGTTILGQTLKDANGTWTGNPTSFAYQWRDCNSAGSACANIGGATSTNYVLASGDIGHTVDLIVTATNAGGSTPAASAATKIVVATPPPAPVNTSLPLITGTAAQGDALAVSTGAWSGNPTSYTYQWSDCNESGTSCSSIGGATSRSYTLTAGDVGHTAEAAVTAVNAAGSSVATSTPTSTITGSAGGLPPGVTLKPIDGGPNYYCSHGFTNACNGGWDHASFFPVGPYWANYVASTWSDIGWNTAYRTQSDLAAMNANGVFSIIASNDNASGGFEDTPVQPSTVGFLAQDEPNCWSLPCGPYPAVAGLATSPNSAQDGRFWWVNNTWQLLKYGTPVAPGGQVSDLFTDTVATPNGTLRHLDIGSVDEYWFSDANGQYPTTYEGGVQYGLGHDLTLAQTECGCRYGDMIDNVPGTQVGLDPNSTSTNDIFEREVQDPASPQGNPASVPAPIAAFVEDGNVGASDAGTITPPEMNWAAWSSIIHGARQLIYFDHSFAGPCQGDDNIENACYQTPYSGQSVSIYAQVKATDSLVTQTAAAINSPLALGYVTVQGAAGSLNGPPATFSGIETRATYSQAGGFTIFSDTRDAEASSPGPVTFHTADNYSGPVTVLCDSRTGADGHLNPGSCVDRTVTASNGTFTDTFAHGSTVHIYQIP